MLIDRAQKAVTLIPGKVKLYRFRNKVHNALSSFDIPEKCGNSFLRCDKIRESYHE